MVSSLASLLFLGIIPSAQALPVQPRTLPGIEVMRVAAPSVIKERFVLPSLSASSALLIDLGSGEEIASKDADTKRPIASLTKVMTALLVLEQGRLGRVVTIPVIADNIGGSTVGLKAGEQMTIDVLLKALLMPSANDAAYALAVTTKGNVGAFVSAMNERAKSIGLSSTHFANPAGLDNPEQYSTPRDLATLVKAALRHDGFRSVVGTRMTTVRSIKGTEYSLRNTNEMLLNPHVKGVKTGTTDDAGECLIVLVEEEGREYLLVLLHSNDRYTDALRVLTALSSALQSK